MNNAAASGLKPFVTPVPALVLADAVIKRLKEQLAMGMFVWMSMMRMRIPLLSLAPYRKAQGKFQYSFELSNFLS